MTIKFGWVKDEYDGRDWRYVPVPIAKLPEMVNLAYMNPHVYDQGSLGSCVFNAFGSMIHGRLRKQGQDFVPSRIFPYYNYLDHTNRIGQDTGATMRGGLKMYAKFGVPPESEWGYDAGKLAITPPKEVYRHAELHQAVEYRSILQNLTDMKSCLATGNTFVGGINIYDSFMRTRDGVIPMPTAGERELGGHAIECVGYDDKIEKFICKNSWGTSWGMHGYFLLPYIYLTNPRLADDFWTVTLVETDI